MYLFASELNAHMIAVVVFIVVMLLWLVLGVEWGSVAGAAPSYRRVGGGLVAWLAVATLAYLTLG